MAHIPKTKKKAALGRHAVNKLDVSNTYPALAGLADIAGTTLSTMTKLGDFPLQPVALAGATMGLLTALANAMPPTPLEHASYQLEQTRADEAYLLEHPLDRPGYEYNIWDFRMIRHMASRYQESWNSLWPSGADVNSLNPENVHALMTDIQNELTHKHGLKREDIIYVGTNMRKIRSLEYAKELTEFKELMARLQTPAKDQEDVSRLLFILNRFFEEIVGKSRRLNSLAPENVHALMEEIQSVLTHEHGIGRDDIIHVSANMGKIKSLEDAKELSEFKELMTRLQTPAEDQEDISTLMFNLNSLFEKSEGKSRELSLSELYQDLCKFKFSQYKMRLEQDRFRLEEDVRILQTMKRNQPASVSAPPAMGTEV